MVIISNFIKTSIAAVCVLALVACGKAPEPVSTASSGSSLKIEGAGSTFVSPLMWRWIEQYDSANSDVSLEYYAVGSGEGIERFLAGGVDYGASDSAMNDEEIARAQSSRGRGVKLIPISAGQVVVAYNISGLRSTLQLPRDVYTDIFRGKITRWDDPRIVSANSGLNLPSKRIQVIARLDSSGTTFAFTNHLSAVSNAWSNDLGTAKMIDWPGEAMVALGNEGVAQRLKITHNSIGYVEYGFAQRVGLPMAALQNRSGTYVLPGSEGGKSALRAAVDNVPADLRLFMPDPVGENAYPIVSLVWLLVHGSYQDSAVKAALYDVIDWSLTQGQTTAEEMGYIPLPDNLVSRAQQELHKY